MSAWLRRRWGRAIFVLFLAGLAAALVVRHLRGPLLRVVAVKRVDLRQTVVSSGRVLAPARIKLGSLTLARVLKVVVVEGDLVTRGQLLVQLDDADAKAALRQAQAQVAQARASLVALRSVSRHLSQESVRRAQLALDEAKAVMTRQRALALKSATTTAKVERAVRAKDRARSGLQSALTRALDTKRGGATYRAILAKVAAAQAAEERAEIRVARARVCSPCAGVMVSRQVEEGDVVPAGKTLLEISRAGPKEILIEPDERNLALLAVGQGGLASADAKPKMRFAVRVATIVPAVDRATGTFRVKLAVDRRPGSPPTPVLVTNMTVSTEIVVGTRRHTLSIPRRAVRALASNKPYALVAHRGRVVHRALKLGLRGEERVEVLGGLDVGESVILPTRRPVTVGTRVRAKFDTHSVSPKTKTPDKQPATQPATRSTTTGGV
ncbi:MAG: efflux RND transporter periplasmic adaptor subunit [Deltaproteobacteria bacterium]|nr:efflux RND transporter periplasmic adaptor subunit [Deltaproteobacteria bacterium]